MTDARPDHPEFETHRAHLRNVAYRMLGSLGEAEDAVQETWLRLHRTDTSKVDNLRGWLTTVVARVCLDELRARKARREDALDESAAAPAVAAGRGHDPEQEAVLASAVGLALLVVLDTLTPAERLAFVLHDMFAVPFDEIAAISGRTPAATRQLASRARRRVHGGTPSRPGDVAQRAVVEAFMAALRAGDFEALVAVLDPDLVVRADGPGGPREIRGAQEWARGAVAFARLAGTAQVALVDGAAGIVFAPGGRLVRALRVTISAGRVARLDVVSDPAALRLVTVAVFA